MVQSHPAEAGQRKRQTRMGIKSQSAMLPDMPAWLVTGSHLKKLQLEDQSNKEHSKHIIRIGALPEYLNLLSWRKGQLLMAEDDHGRLKDLGELDLDFSSRFLLDIEAIYRTDFEFVPAFQDSLFQ